MMGGSPGDDRKQSNRTTAQAIPTSAPPHPRAPRPCTADTIPANQSDCPYSYYRTSGDISASYASTMSKLQTVMPHANKNVSFPGCWAFPDALEV